MYNLKGCHKKKIHFAKCWKNGRKTPAETPPLRIDSVDKNDALLAFNIIEKGNKISQIPFQLLLARVPFNQLVFHLLTLYISDSKIIFIVPLCATSG